MSTVQNRKIPQENIAALLQSDCFVGNARRFRNRTWTCLLYTSDAADE